MENNEMRAKLFAKMAKVAFDIGAMEEAGYNAFSKFKYINYQQINAKLRALLHENKLFIDYAVDNLSEVEAIVKDKVHIRCKADLIVSIIDTETGYLHLSKAKGSASDTGDKASGKAITEAVKRWEMKAFHISSVEDKDPDETTIQNVAPSQSAPRFPVLKRGTKAYNACAKAICEGYTVRDFKMKYTVTDDIAKELEGIRDGK